MKKLVADRLGAQVAGQPHPDAELLSAFAENALSPSERAGVLEHLGTCAACREILFLALPDHSDTQKVLAVPKPRPRFAIRWATAAACVVIAAAVFVGRRELTRTAPVAQKAESPAGYVQPPTVAMEKAPAEMDALRELQVPAKSAPAAPKALPEAKHITATPGVALDFKKSDQVVVEAAPRSDLTLEAKAKELPLNGRNRAEVMKQTPGAATTPANADMVADSRVVKDLPVQGRDAGELLKSPVANAPMPAQNIGGPVATANRNQYAYSAPPAFGLAKQVAGAGVLGGTVFDPSGAVVADVKVTTVGPGGTKTVTSDGNGKFLFDQLPAGEYSLKAAARGFKVAELPQVAVLSGKSSDVRVTLNVGSATEAVEVSASAVALQTEAADAVKVENQSVNGAMPTTTESRVTKKDKARLSRKQAARTRQDEIAGKAGRGSGEGVAAAVFQWTLSPEGTVQRSLDGGKNWQSVSVLDQSSFRTLSANTWDVWVGGNVGVLYHSTDSGQHWTRVIPEANGEKLTADVTRISFNDLQNGVISTSNGQLWTTSDGGHTWQRK